MKTLVVIALRTILFNQEAQHDHPYTKDSSLFRLFIRKLLTLWIKKYLVLVRLIHNRNVQKFQLFLFLKVENIRCMKNRPFLGSLIMLTSSLHTEFDEIENLERIGPARLSPRKLELLKHTVSLGTFEHSAQVAITVLDDSFEINMRTAKKWLICDSKFDHIAAIFAISLYPSQEILLLRVVDRFKNPLIHKQALPILTIPHYSMPSLAYPYNLEITKSKLLSSITLVNFVCFGILFSLHYCTHLNSYYYK